MASRRAPLLVAWLVSSVTGCDSDLRDKLRSPLQAEDDTAAPIASEPEAPTDTDAGAGFSDSNNHSTSPHFATTTADAETSGSAPTSSEVDPGPTSAASEVQLQDAGASAGGGATSSPSRASDGGGSAPQEPTMPAADAGNVAGAPGTFPSDPPDTSTSSDGGAGAGDVGAGGAGGSPSSGGAAGSAGAGGASPAGSCGELFTELTGASQSRDFYVDFETLFDLSDTTVTLRLRADYGGETGGIQIFVLTTNEGFSYANWTNLEDLGSWTTLTLTPAKFAETSGGGFTPAQVHRFGIQVTSGTASASTWGDVSLVVDSITFSDLPELNMHFDTGMPLAVGLGNTANPATRLRACEGT